MRSSFRDDTPLRWIRVHDLPDFVYFNHSIHVKKGIGCETCHGRVDQMPLMLQQNSLQMEWCLECHRDPEQLRPSAQRGVHDGLPAGRTAVGARPAARQGIRHRGATPAARRATGDVAHEPKRNDIEALRARLDGTRGREYWRSLEALSETAEFKEFLHREFPQNASEWLDPVGRRGFLKLMGASLALAGVSACTRQPTELIVPYVRQPEELVPGKPLFFATAMPFAGAGMGLLVENHEGRPTKIEGNPDHPSSRGATDLFAQAAILGLYDPDRSTTLTNLGEIRPFSAFVLRVRGMLSAQQAKQGSGLRILTETVASPTLAAQIQAVLTQFPQAKWVQWEPSGRHNAREGSRLAFGEYVDAQYAHREGRRHPLARRRLHVHRRRRPQARARVRVAPPRREPIDRSRTASTRSRALRPTPARRPITGCRCAPPRSRASRARSPRSLASPAPARRPCPRPPPRGSAPLVSDLQAARGRSLVIAGDGQPPSVHALAHAMNARARQRRRDRRLHADARKREPMNQLAGLRELVGEMNAGTVDFLLITRRQPGLHGARPT